MKEQPIKINDIKQVMCFLYSPDDEFIGTIESEYSWNDVRIQIMEQKLSGYYVMFNEHKIEIDSDGRCETWPDGFYDITEKQLEKLFGGVLYSHNECCECGESFESEGKDDNICNKCAENYS